MKDRNLQLTDKVLYIVQKDSNTVVPVQWKNLIFCRVTRWQTKWAKELGLFRGYMLVFDIYDGNGIATLLTYCESETVMRRFRKKLRSLGFLNRSARRIYIRKNLSLWLNLEFSYVRHNQSDKDYEIYKGEKYLGIMDMEIWNDLYLFKRRWKRRNHELN